MEAGGEFRLQGIVDRTVTVKPGHPGKGGRANLHRIMCLTAGRCAGMAMVKVGLVHYIQLGRGKSCKKRCPDARGAACQFLRH